MFNQVLKPILTLITAGFSKGTPRIQRLAGFAGAALIFCIAICVYTTWVSQPAYTLAVGDVILGWVAAGVIAYVIFHGQNVVGSFVAETMLGIKNQVDSQTVLLTLLLIAGLAYFDASRGYYVGAGERAEQEYRAQSFQESNTTPLPYESEIASIDKTIQELRNERVKWKGEMVMPWKNHDKIQKQMSMREKYLDQQMKLQDEAFTVHTQRENLKARQKQDSLLNNQMINLWMYIIMLPVTILLQYTLITIDIADGERNGDYNTEMFRKDNPYNLPETDSNNRDSEEVQANESPSLRRRILNGFFSMLGFGQGSNLEEEEEIEEEDGKEMSLEKSIRFLEKYKHVIPDIKKPWKTISENHGIGKSTIYKIRETLRALDKLKYYDEYKAEQEA